MSKKDYTFIGVVLDRSGSMGSVLDDTIGGFNNFLKENQSVEDDEGLFTLAQFSSDYSLIYDAIPIKEVPPLDTKSYSVYGWTALLDAIGKTIVSMDQKLSVLEESEKPKKVIMVVITDGQDNSSKEYTKSAIASMIKTKESDSDWEFLFLGANMDSVKEAASFGFSGNNVAEYATNAVGTKETFDLVSDSIKSYRRMSDDSRQVNKSSILSNQLNQKSYKLQG